MRVDACLGRADLAGLRVEFELQAVGGADSLGHSTTVAIAGLDDGVPRDYELDGGAVLTCSIEFDCLEPQHHAQESDRIFAAVRVAAPRASDTALHVVTADLPGAHVPRDAHKRERVSMIPVGVPVDDDASEHLPAADVVQRQPPYAPYNE